MTNKIAYALLKEFPMPRLLSALESANEEPPDNMLEQTEKISRLLGQSNEGEQVLRSVARLMLAAPALKRSIASKSQTVDELLSNESVVQAIELLKSAGFGVLHLAEQKTEQRSPALSRFLKICQEELSSRT